MCPISPAERRTDVDHLSLMVWHAVLVSLFFAFLWRKTKRDRWELGLKTFVIMVLGGILFGWIMFPFP
jgi:hypothetical protein